MLWEDNYLAHYGIQGQKWGVRRFQNADGSLTEAGKKRYYDYSTRAENAYNGARDMARLRNATEQEGKKHGEAWGNYGKLESRMAKAAIKYQNKANKLLPASERKDMYKLLKDQGVESDKFSKKAQAKAEREAYKAVMKSNANDLDQAQKVAKDAFDKSLDDQEAKRLNTAEDYEKAGQKKFDGYNEAVMKYDQDTAIDFLDKDPRMIDLCQKIYSGTKGTYDQVREAFAKERSSNKNNKQYSLESSKAYYNYAVNFDKIASDYISKKYKPEEQELARAALFWQFFD